MTNGLKLSHYYYEVVYSDQLHLTLVVIKFQLKRLQSSQEHNI